MARRGQFQKGQVGYWAGKKRTFSAEHRKKLAFTSANRSPETRAKLSASKKGKRPKNLDSLLGENHWNWKGGIANLYRSLRRIEHYLRWRSRVYERDNWTCQTCGVRGTALEAHHIRAFSHILKDNNIKTKAEAVACAELWDLDNGVTLCHPCHSLTDNFKSKARKR